MPSYPETPSGDELNQVADHFRQQAQRHADRGDQSSTVLYYQAAETSDTMHRRLTEPTPARRQPEDQC